MSSKELVDQFIEFYRGYYRNEIGELAQRYPKERQSLYIEYDDLYRFNRDLADDWTDQPDQIIPRAEEALYLFDLPADVDLRDEGGANVRLTDSREAMDTMSVSEVDPDLIGQYVAVRGQLSRVTGKNFRVEDAAWECQRCGTMNRIPQPQSSVQEPNDCHGCEREGPFRVSLSDSDLVNQRKLKIEQLPDERNDSRGESAVAYVDEDLCDIGGPNGLADRSGEEVIIFATMQGDQSDLNGRNAKPEIDAWLEVEAIEFASRDGSDIDVDEHREEFEEIAARDDCVEVLRDSIVPEIEADDELENVLEAAVAWLFNGYRVDPEHGGSIRGDLHFGLIGDPGRGKSTILSALSKISPVCEYRSGTGLSAVGLTAAVVQEEFAGSTEWTLQPGVLPRSNGGHCIIDEVDDVVDESTKKMHDALEGEQMLKVDKADIQADLKTRTALLASGNPIHGRFDRYEPISDQIDLDPALISRMDVLFAVQDIPDPETDAAVADKTLDSFDELSRQMLYEGGQISDEPDLEATDREVSVETFRAMVHYARNEIFPVLSPEAKEMLREFYIDVRTLNDDADDPIPATPRTLGAGIRLSVAYARAELSETVEPRHAERAIRVSKKVVGLNYDPESGKFDASRVEKGTTDTQKKRIKRIKAVIQETEEEYDDGAPIDEIKERAEAMDVDGEKVDKEMQKLLDKGMIYEASTDHYRTS